MLLTDKPAHAVNKTFRLSLDTITLMDMIQNKFSDELGYKIPYSKIIEIALYQLKDKSIRQLIK